VLFGPKWVVVCWNDFLSDYQYLCAFNNHFIGKHHATKFWFKINAEVALSEYIDKYGKYYEHGRLERDTRVINLNKVR
jgi:hypothetical protein